MHVVEVIPIGRGSAVSSLSYFSSDAFSRGDIVTVPLRNGAAQAIVTDTEEVGAAKTALRAATFTLRKLPQQKPAGTLPPSFLQTVYELSDYYAAHPGAVLFALLPAIMRKGTVPLPKHAPTEIRGAHQHRLLMRTTDDRYQTYLSIIRSSFAEKTSILFVVPTVADATYAFSVLSSGITEHVITLNSTLSTKKLAEAYQKLRDETHPKLIIATPQFAFIDRTDISTVVLERARASGYRSVTRPYIDYRHALLTHAKNSSREVISADLLLRAEDELLLREDLAQPFDEHPKRIPLPGDLNVIEMIDNPNGVTPFALFSETVIASLQKTLKQKERVFMFAARRGLAPVVACGDCGHILRAPESGAPLSLHRTTKNGIEERWLVCSVSGYRQRALDLCPVCGSWRLRERGIGIQHVFDELKNHIDSEAITLFDHTTATTPKKAQALEEQFYKKKGGVLLGTALAIPYLHKPVHESIVTSMDALRAIPSWRQQEEIMHILLTLREKTTGTVHVQTRTTDNDIFAYVSKGRVADFYTEELDLRSTFHYPPYTTFIHFTWQGNHASVEKTKEQIESLFHDEQIAIYAPAQKTSHDSKSMRQALLRIDARNWPNESLTDRIKALPQSVRVMINPDRIV